ncbi:unnamed protein product [Citrullus colocynthis]|uniref:Secreted protein n=1 Tax=Citrullus colocynthis TaxID=252529 RepID=A0ABP0YTI3_9ROSI
MIIHCLCSNSLFPLFSWISFTLCFNYKGKRRSFNGFSTLFSFPFRFANDEGNLTPSPAVVNATLIQFNSNWTSIPPPIG